MHAAASDCFNVCRYNSNTYKRHYQACSCVTQNSYPWAKHGDDKANASRRRSTLIKKIYEYGKLSSADVATIVAGAEFVVQTANSRHPLCEGALSV